MKPEIKWETIYWIVLAALFAVSDKPIIMLAGYAVFFAHIVLCGKSFEPGNVLKLIIYSIIIPNNYIVIAMVVGYALIYCITDQRIINGDPGRRNLINIFISALILYAIVSAIAMRTPFANMVLALLYYSPLLASIALIRRLRFADIEELYELLKRVIVIQVTWIIVYACTHISFIQTAHDLDWVAGTFGEKQGNIFFIFCAFLSFMFLYGFQCSRSKDLLVFFVITIILMVLTGSIGLTMFYAGACVIVLIINPKVGIKYKIGLIVAGIIGFVVLINANPEWVVEDLYSMTDTSALMEKVKKLDAYYRCFAELPGKDRGYALFGTGFAQGTSRTAMTGTGYYATHISQMLGTSYTSRFFSENVLPYLKSYLDGRLGLAYAPFSAILSIQSELGYLGTMLFAAVFITLLKRRSTILLLICAFFLIILLWDNYLEYAKVMFVFIFAYMFCGETECRLQQRCDQLS